MVIVDITPSGGHSRAVKVAAPSMASIYAVLRDLPYKDIEVHGVFTRPSGAGIDYFLPEDERKLATFLLAESDKGDAL